MLVPLWGPCTKIKFNKNNMNKLSIHKILNQLQWGLFIFSHNHLYNSKALISIRKYWDINLFNRLPELRDLWSADISMVSPAYTLKRGLTHGRGRKVDKSLSAAGEKIPDLYMTWQTTIFEKMHEVAHLDTLRLDHILHPYYGFICTNFYLQMTKYTIWLIKKENNTFFIIKKTQYTICTCI